MSILPQLTRRSLRIVALPLVTAHKTTGRPSTDTGHLTYYHFVTPPAGEESKDGWSQWAVNKASDLWTGFGKAPEGHWKRRTFLYGQRLNDRIDFEELALKSLDPSLGPTLTRFGKSESDIKPEEHEPIPLIYPSTQCTLPLDHIHTLVEKRTPRHRRGIYTWLLVSPLTAPFMIIPIIPNLPFFFCIWRAWSHWKAYKSSSYLGQLLQKGAIVPQPSEELDAVYKKYSSKTEPSKESPGRKLLLTKEAVPELMALFDLKPDSGFATDVYRALEQARLRLEQARPDIEK